MIVLPDYESKHLIMSKLDIWPGYPLVGKLMETASLRDF